MSIPSSQAIGIFNGHWFARHEPKLALTEAEKLIITAALGTEPKRWDAFPDLASMKEILDSSTQVLDRVGPRLLNVAIGMRGGGPVVKLLIDVGVKLDLDLKVYNVLHEAAWAGATDSLEALFKAGVVDATPVSVKKPHTGWPDNLSLMYWAAYGGFPVLAKLLVQYGAGVHHELQIKGNGERGTTSLQEASAPSPWGEQDPLKRAEKKLEVAKILIEDGAVYDICSASGIGDERQVERLLDQDQSLATKSDDFGMTPLHWASRAGKVGCLELLLTAGAEVNALNRNHRSSLQLAAEANEADVIRGLVRAGADVNTQDKKGRSPLHRATYEGCVDAAETLLEVGANPRLTNKKGKTAFEIARKDLKHLKKRVP